MDTTDTRKLIQAARTAVSLIGLVHQAMWDLFPNEMLLLQENDEQRLLDAIDAALQLMPEAQPISNKPHSA